MSNTLTRSFFVTVDGEDDDAHLYEGGWGFCYDEKESPNPGTILVTLQMEEVKDCNKYSYLEWARNFQKKSGATVTESKNDTFTHLTIHLQDPAETPTYLGFFAGERITKICRI